MKKRISIILSLLLAACIFAGSAAALSAERAQTAATDPSVSLITGETRVRNNVNGNSYNRYNSVVRNYLRPTDDGWMRIYGNDDGTLLAEYYDMDYRYIGNRFVETGLPLFGGFFETGDRYYVLTGDLNREEKDNKEVFRITCFDRNWRKLGSDSIYGANTTVPFDAGRADFAVYGDLLIVRSCHEIYTRDGINHQTNLTLVFDMKNNVFKDYFTDVASIKSAGFLSHSFNQFVAIDSNGTVVCLDHGDSHIRAAALGRFTTTAKNLIIHQPGYQTYEYTPLISYYGALGDNYTAAMVGGLEISGSSYITVGADAGQNENYRSNRAFNAYISVTDKSVKELENAQTKITYLTSFKEEDKRYASNPHLVKISDDLFLVMWNEMPVLHNIFVVDIPMTLDENCLMKYLFIDGEGNPLSDIRTAPVDQGILVSECEPIVRQNKIYWFVSDADRFYSIIEMDLNGNITVHGQVVPDGMMIYPVDLSRATVSLRSFDMIPDDTVITEENIDDYVVVCYNGIPLKRGRDYELSATNPITLRASQGIIGSIQLRMTTVPNRSFVPLYYSANWAATANSLYLSGATRRSDGVYLSVSAHRGVGYRVYRRELESDGDYELIGSVPARHNTTFVDTTARRSKGYTYVVREFTYAPDGAEVLSPPSQARSVMPSGEDDPTEPPAPATEPPTQPPIVYGIVGDADRSGDISILDATTIQRRLANLIGEDSINAMAADVDDDGEVSILDATSVQRYLAGIPTGYPIGKGFYAVLQTG